jgi:hypothetical protein
MWKKIALGIIALGILCAAIGFAVTITQTSFGASKEAANMWRRMATMGQ